jgi:tetratricopeptide (TPR) repeat protein
MNRDTLGEKHLHLPRMIGNLGRCLRELGEYAEAEALLSDALAKKKAQLGERHPSTGKTLYDMAKLRFLQGRSAEAETLCREALAIQTEADHPDQEASRKLLDQIAGAPSP